MLTDYYAQRAPHYEEVYQKPERQADLTRIKCALALALAGRQVLDVACGSGYFTAAYAAHAQAALGIDSNQAVLNLARGKMLPHAEFRLGDAYQLDGISRHYDAALLSFWWSHIPKARRVAFFEQLHQHLAPGARVILIDNRFVAGNSTPIAHTDHAGDQWQDRPREDGSRQLVMKNYPTRQLLLDSMTGTASTHWWQLEYYWWFDYQRPNSSVMPLKRTSWPAGTVIDLEFDSKALRHNHLGDPHVRHLHVYLPPQYDSEPKRRFPVLYDLVGYTGSGQSHTNWKSFGENVPERVARLIAQQRMEPVIVVFPDCFTAYGGNQYINSSAIGRYADYLIDELVPLVDKRFRTLASRDHRGCFGKSSGGYGAMVHAMKHADIWGAVACHSGDAYFDFVYRNDLAKVLDHLARYSEPKRAAGTIDVLAREKQVKQGLDDGRIRRFLDAFFANRKVSGLDTHVIMMICMAASYDPDPKAPNGFRMPLNLETGEMIDKRWKAWLKHDPINMIADHDKALKSLRGLWIDCGWADQYSIHYGARILSKRLTKAGVEHVYEEFDDNHSDIDYRMDVSLPYLASALGAD